MASSSVFRELAINMPVDGRTGWGVYGFNLGMQLIARGLVPVMAMRADWSSINPMPGSLLMSAHAKNKEITSALEEESDEQFELNCPVVTALGNWMGGAEKVEKLIGTRNLAIIVFENTAFTAAELEKIKPFDTIVTGCNWNAQILRRHGVKDVKVVLQGVDPTLFHPGPASGAWKNHFVIFSGGKLEYRKGQDIIIAAVRKFQEKHPETVLAFAWHNAYPLTMAEIDASGIVRGIPEVSPTGGIDFSKWLGQQGMKNFINLGTPLNWHLPPILREADVAIFASRAEGATNFAAMECLACGIPTILSANTGHLDLVSEEICFPLKSQPPAKATRFFPHVEGWGESSVDELVENLEKVYRDREEAKKRAAAAVQAMRKISWEHQVTKLLNCLS